MSSAPDPPWTVEFINEAVLLARLRQLEEEAIQLGVYSEFRAAVHSINDNLQTDPLGWGDQLRDAPDGSYTMFQRCIVPLIVVYFVHYAARAVWVRDIRPYGLGFSQG